MSFFRKLFALPIAAALLLCGAGISQAASPVTFDGHLRLRSWFFDNYFNEKADPNGRHASRSDSWVESRLRINVSFQPNDNVEIRWRAQGPGSARWGSKDGNDFLLRSEHFFGIARTQFGDFSVGRVSSDMDSAGLQTLGYLPGYGMGTQFYAFDSDSDTDGFMYRWHSDIFGIKAYYAKKATTVQNSTVWDKDADWDRFSVEPYWSWDTGGASLAVQYDSDKTLRPDGRDSLKYVTVNPAFAQSFLVGDNSKLTFHAEAKLSWGKRSFSPNSPAALDPLVEDKVTGFGAYADLDLDYSSGDVALAAWYLDGQDEKEGADPLHRNPRNLVDPGSAFYPFLIFYSAYGAQPDGTKHLEGRELPGHWALAVMGRHVLNDWATLTYGAGHFRRTADFTRADGSKASRSMGTEFNLGLSVKLMDNLTWGTNLAVFDTGSYYDGRYSKGTPGAGLDKTIWGWGNELMFSF
ncbi:MAG: hypothetical protein LBQ12_12440 [Deltaproteobacteria bacterium]|jgi:hypothetical protein|nr:hypothetical protein [Deltaproteobacteria bacterium]